ncbi:MAG: ABC transporter ATP-binding protein [Phycisphaerae bacterium]|nr:ABC transporter ATP-binding protein [Phycisphaerae bacterium]
MSTNPHAPATTMPLLSAHRLSKTYRMGRVDVPVLRDASIEVQQGEWVSVVGLSGSGKSTLLHLLGGLDRPDRPQKGDRDAGTVHFEGRLITTLGAHGLNQYRNRAVGFVFQFYHLLPELTVLENAMLPAMKGRSPLAWFAATPMRQRAAELLERFGLAHRLTHRPNELSGGERQRVAIARALMNEPKVLLADEPTGNLDANTGGEILTEISNLHRNGLTVVMVTHDPAIAALADRTVRLLDGRVVSSGS